MHIGWGLLTLHWRPVNGQDPGGKPQGIASDPRLSSFFPLFRWVL